MAIRMLPAAALVGLLLQCPSARADPAAAEALFREGRALLESGDLTRACEKLEASNALDPSAGTLLNLASCRAKQGKTATAWAHFVSAERLARNQGRSEQANEARQRAAELEPQLSTLTLRAPHAAPDLVVRRDGHVVQPASLGTPMPTDPGRTVIELSAPGYEAARIELSIGASADRRVIELPALRAVAPQARSGSNVLAVAEQSHDGGEPRGSRAIPWAIGGVGAGALAAGSVLGAMALSSNSRAVEQCDAGKEDGCRDAQRRRDDQALASTVCFGVGLVGVSVAAIWLLTGSSGRNQAGFSYDGEVTRESALLKMRVGF